jgi:hypothetical protein
MKVQVAGPFDVLVAPCQRFQDEGVRLSTAAHEFFHASARGSGTDGGQARE